MIVVGWGAIYALQASILFFSVFSFYNAHVVLLASSNSGGHWYNRREGDGVARLEMIARRAEWSQSECTKDAHNKHHRRPNESVPTDVAHLPSLPPWGISHAIRKWTQASDATSTPLEMPPPTACHVTNFTIVTMAYNTDHFGKLYVALTEVFPSWTEVGLSEIIFVWNAPRSHFDEIVRDGDATLLGNATLIQNAEYAAKMLKWHADTTNPFRIFFSHERGLGNDILNRYHPKLHPRNEAILYFDDDGPFYTTDVDLIRSGFHLWKRISDVQVGMYGRRLSYTDGRQFHNLNATARRTLHQSDANVVNSNDNLVPFCPSNGNGVKYHHESFADFGASVILPSGSMIHRRYLDIIWHPAFQEARRFISDHDTHPDDAFVSLLISHLSGRGAKLYPRKKYKPKSRIRANHRRLMWENTKNWFSLREHAASEFVKYFGGIGPVSVGWCDGTPYMNMKHENSSSVLFAQCKPEFPSIDLVPWMHEGGVSHRQCS